MKLKPAIALGLSAPLVWLGHLIWLDVQNPGAGLGADAGESLVHYLGQWSLIVLLLAYSVSPVRRLTHYPPMARTRRMVGLFAFAYVCLHLFSYMTFYLGFSWSALLEDFVERPYITAGLGGFFCLLIMAATSTQGWQRRLKQNWRRIHRLVFPALGLALLHFCWLTRDGFGEVLLYLAWFVVLSAERLWSVNRTRRLHSA